MVAWRYCLKKVKKYGDFWCTFVKIWGPGMGFAPKAACTGPSRSLLQDPQKGSKMVKIRSNLGSLKVPQGPSRVMGQNRHILAGGQRFGLRRAQNGVKIGSKWHFHWPLIGKMTKIDFFNRKSGQNSQNLRSRAWVWEALSRSSSPKAACTGPSRNLPPGPSKGSQNDQN